MRNLHGEDTLPVKEEQLTFQYDCIKLKKMQMQHLHDSI